MPLTDEQKAALETLKGADAEDFSAALKETAQPLYQKVFNLGHSTATAAAKTDKAELERQLTAEREAKEAAEQEATELKANTPDRAAIDAQWQAKLEREKKPLQEKLDAAEQKVARLTTDTVQEKVHNALLAVGLRPRMAGLLAKDRASRIRFDESGNPQLMEPGGDIPVQIPTGKTVFQVLAEQEKSAAEPEDILVHGDSGSGRQGGSGGATGKTAQQIEDEKRASGAYTL